MPRKKKDKIKVVEEKKPEATTAFPKFKIGKPFLMSKNRERNIKEYYGL